MEIKRIQASSKFSQAVIYNKTVYISGQVAANPSTSIEEQTEQILRQIEVLLAQTGSNKFSIVSTNIWLANMQDYVAMNTVWEKWLTKEHMPARATVEAALANPQYKIEISCIAACDN